MKQIRFVGQMLTLLTIVTVSSVPVLAQNRQSFTLNEAIRFATERNINVKNSQLDALGAEARIQEIRAVALPQVSFAGQITGNLAIQTAFLPAVFAGGKPDDPPIAVQFGTKFQGFSQLSLNQLLFDASYKVGLRAADVYRELSQKNVNASKIATAEQVAKAYYGVLVNEERIKLLDLNVTRLDTLFRNTRALNNQGFVEKIDVDRLEVQVNNLRAERQNVKNLVDLSYYLLKFQMGLGINEDITLTEKIQDINLDEAASTLTPISAPFNYGQRIEYSQLQSQLQLADLDIQNTQKAYYPRLSFGATYGYNTGRNTFGELVTAPWFRLSALSLNLSVPVFDGFSKKYQSQQKRFTLQKAQQSAELLKNSIDLQVRQSAISLTNTIQTLKTQKRNIDLAKEVVRVVQIKYKEGVGSNIEVLDAENSFRQAQTNYFTSLYDYLLTKVDFDKANGKLLTE